MEVCYPDSPGNFTCYSSAEFCLPNQDDGISKSSRRENREKREAKLFVGTYEKLTLKDHSIDFSNKEMVKFPMEILKFGSALKILYLQNNGMEELPCTFFDQLPNLAWCDLRWNVLEMLPEFSKVHTGLRVLQIQNNRVSVLPLSLGLYAVNLRTLGLRGNPIADPPVSIVEEGLDKIREYLVTCYNQEKQQSGGDASQRANDRSGADSRLLKFQRSLSTFSLQECSTEGPTNIQFESRKMVNLTSALYKSLSKSKNSSHTKVKAGGAPLSTPRSRAVKNFGKRISDHLKYTNDVWRDVPFNGLSGRDLAAKSLEQMRQEILRKFSLQRDKLVQKIKDREVLSKWRFETSELQKAGRKPGTCSIVSPPYGTSIHSSTSNDTYAAFNQRYIYLSPPEFEREVSCCSKKLQEYVANPSSMNDSESALQRLQECEDIQRRLCSLKLKTSGFA